MAELSPDTGLYLDCCPRSLYSFSSTCKSRMCVNAASIVDTDFFGVTTNTIITERLYKCFSNFFLWNLVTLEGETLVEKGAFRLKSLN